MRRALARGRVFPQFYSTDRRYRHLSLKALSLFPLMWANADDQGRLSGNTEEIKDACCPGVKHIAEEDIPGILQELEQNKLILCYESPRSSAIQFQDWWEVHHKLQWAWPSEWPPPEGWSDHLRYKSGREQVITVNWPPFMPSTAGGPPPSPEDVNERGKGKGIRTRRGRGNSRESSPENSGGDSGEHDTSPLLTTASSLFVPLVRKYEEAFGRPPDSRNGAQLNDLAEELAVAGGATEQEVHDAFHEAATMPQIKWTVSYVRAILCDWLDIPKDRK